VGAGGEKPPATRLGQNVHEMSIFHERALPLPA